jgi:hypothetical protein
VALRKKEDPQMHRTHRTFELDEPIVIMGAFTSLRHAHRDGLVQQGSQTSEDRRRTVIVKAGYPPIPERIAVSDAAYAELFGNSALS